MVTQGSRDHARGLGPNTSSCWWIQADPLPRQPLALPAVPVQPRTHLAEHSKPQRGAVTAQECRKTVRGPGAEARLHRERASRRQDCVFGEHADQPCGCHQCGVLLRPEATAESHGREVSPPLG